MVKRDVYVVTVPRIEGVTRERMTAFIKDAIESWGGQLRPANAYDDPNDVTAGDPLGPPCVLMKRGAVRVLAEARPESNCYHPCYYSGKEGEFLGLKPRGGE